MLLLYLLYNVYKVLMSCHKYKLHADKDLMDCTQWRISMLLI